MNNIKKLVTVLIEVINFYLQQKIEKYEKF